MKSIPTLFPVFLFFLCSSFTAIAEITPCETSKGEGLAAYVIESSGAPTPALLGLAKALGLKHMDTFPAIADELKRAWYRPQGQERWQIPEKNPGNRKLLLSSFEKLGMFCEKRPNKPHYAHALLLGGLLARVRIRLAFLSREWERGIHFDTIAFLGSRGRWIPYRRAIATSSIPGITTCQRGSVGSSLGVIPRPSSK